MLFWNVMCKWYSKIIWTVLNDLKNMWVNALYQITASYTIFPFVTIHMYTSSRYNWLPELFQQTHFCFCSYNDWIRWVWRQGCTRMSGYRCLQKEIERKNKLNNKTQNMTVSLLKDTFTFIVAIMKSPVSTTNLRTLLPWIIQTWYRNAIPIYDFLYTSIQVIDNLILKIKSQHLLKQVFQQNISSLPQSGYFALGYLS